MAFGDGIISGYQLVLAKYEPTSPSRFVPETIFHLYLAPTSVTFTPRMAHSVTALINGAHVESGRRLLADLTVAINPGAGLQLSSTADGSPTLTDGKGRDQELRAFLETANDKIRLGSHRLEFHADPRQMHYVIVPSGISYSMSSHDSSRIGGAIAELNFTVVADIAGAITLFGQINEALESAFAGIRRATGAIALSLVIAREAVNIPLEAVGMVTDVISQGRECVRLLDEVVNGVKEVASLPVTLLQSMAGLAAEVKRAYVDTEDFVSADFWRDLGESIELAWASVVTILKRSSNAPGEGASSSIGAATKYNNADLDTIALALEEEGDELAFLISNVPSYPTQYVEHLATYTGWVPHTVKDGETLVDIAGKKLGDEDLWIDLTLVNGLDDPSDIAAGSTLKLPITGGGIPWSLDAVTDLEELQAVLDELLYYRDIKVVDVGDFQQIDWVINPTTLTDILTVSGVDNFKQRYHNVIFRTEAGSNPSFPGVGVFLGIGRKRLQETIGLTHISARHQLLSDPRTVGLKTTRQVEEPDGVEVGFEVETINPDVNTVLNLKVS